VFEAKGYANARVEDITDAAQYAVGSFYTYFASKEAAFEAVTAGLGTDGEARPTGPARSAEPHDVAALERRIAHANQRYHRGFVADGRLWAVVEEAALRHPGPRAMLRHRWDRYREATAAALAPWRDAGVIAEDVDLLATVTALSAMTEWIMSLSRIYDAGFGRAVGVADLTPLWLRALGAGHPGSGPAGPAGPAVDPVANPAAARPDAAGPAVEGPPPPPPPAPARDGRTTRDRLLDAGLAEWSRRGVGDVPVSDIAATAGVSVGSFYTYFPSKPDLLAALLDERPGLLYADPATVLAAHPSRPPDVAAAARALTGAHLASVAAHEGLWRTVVEGSLTEPPVRAVVNARRQAWVRSLTGLVRRWQAEGAADPALDAALTGAALGALTERTSHLWVLLGDPPPLDDGARSLAACWQRILAP
jgi:AcrR family transcriptional regulator